MPHTNPLLQYWELPPWSIIRAEHLVPAIEAIITENRRALADIVASQSVLANWDNLVLAVDEIDARLDEALGIIETLSMVKHETNAWNRAITLCEDAATRYKTEQMSNRVLFSAYKALAQSSTAESFDESRKAVLTKILLRFHLSGIDLPLEQQQTLERLNLHIDLLKGLFMSNLESASAAWSRHIDDVSQLNGLSQTTKDRLALNAQQAGRDGWLIRLDQDTYSRIMVYAENRALRQEVFIAYSTRASDQGPLAGQFDNGPVLELLLALRHQKAQLLGYENFAQLRLTTEQAGDTAQVRGFLHRQVTQATPILEQDAHALKAFALELGVTDVKPWDHEFLAEQLRQHPLADTLKNLRAYFPLDGTLRRLCLFSERMFGIQIDEQTEFERWHDSVRLFKVSEFGQVIGHIYLDPYHRTEAPDYAWTATRRNRRVGVEGQLTLPIATLHGNFMPGVGDQPCLLTHKNLQVLFHEFGHCLQHVLTRSPHFRLSGISQLGRDTAEFAGQLFEHWCLSREILLWLAAHHQTGERLTEGQVDAALTAAKTQTSLQTANLLMGAIFDFELHRCQGDGRSVQQVFDEVNSQFPYLQLPPECRFANSFDYMVTGYAASVYAYLWSGKLASEAFKRFQQDWVFNPKTGRAFREAFFSPGDSRSLLIALEEFMGRPLTDDFFGTSPQPMTH